MPDICTPITFSKEFKKLINSKINDENFTYIDWSNDDLKPIRKYIRDYYRDILQKCAYCRNEISLQSANNCHIEHIIPKSTSPKLFLFEPINLCVICADCNEIKRNKKVEENTTTKKVNRKYPKSSKSFLIYHPHFDNYEEHIFKVHDIYIDLSTKGSFTIHTCKLNRNLHKYGIGNESLSNSELFNLFNSIMNEDNILKRSNSLNKLRKFLLLTK